MKKQPKLFKTEAELCTAFIADAKRQGWTAYPETGSFDIVLVRADVQVGIQAKMAFNATLLRQVLPETTSIVESTGFPHHVGILLPAISADVRDVCRLLGIALFHPRDYTIGGSDFVPDIEAGITHDRFGYYPMELPDYVPDVQAGASGPVVLTEWKVRALRLCAVLEIRGHITRDDFKRYGLDMRRWLLPFNGWLRAEHLKVNHYVAGEKLMFPKQHPTVFAQIVEEVRAELASYSEAAK